MLLVLFLSTIQYDTQIPTENHKNSKGASYTGALLIHANLPGRATVFFLLAARKGSVPCGASA